MSYFLVLFFMILFGVELSAMTKKAFGRVAAFANFILIFILYIAGLFKNLRIGMYVWFALIGVAGILLTLNLVKNKNFKPILDILKNPLFIFYVGMGITFGILFYGKISLDYDELTYWGLVSKNMYTYDNFGNLGDTTTMFNRYVPATGIFMYAFQFFNPKFVNGNLYAAFDLLVISMLMPICEKFKNKLSFGFLGTLILMLGIPVVFKTNIYYNLLVDGILAVMTAYIYISYIQDRGNCNAYTVAEIGLACFVITLTKSSGIALASISLCYIIADVLIRGRKEFISFIKKPTNCVVMFLAIAIVIGAKVSWNIYVNVNNVRAGWDSSEMTGSAIIEWIKNPNDFQSQVTAKFINTFFIGKPFYNWNVYLALPAVLLFSIYGVAALIVGLRRKKVGLSIAMFSVSSLALIGYAFFMLLLYLFSFTYAESLRLASYPRYMGSYVSASIIMWFVLIVDTFLTTSKKPEPKKTKQYLWAIPASILASIMTVGALIGGAFVKADCKKFTEPYKEWIAAVEKLDDTDRVYYLMKDFGYYGNNVREYIRIRFYATPTRCSGFVEGGSMADGRNAPAAFTGNPFIRNKMNKEKLAEQLLDYDYFFLDEIDEEFINEYGELFADEIKAKVLYRIEKEGGIKLFLV